MSHILELDITQPARRNGKLLLAPFRYLTRKEHYLGPPSISLLFKFFLTGCLFPAGCIALLLVEGAPSATPLWQSGKLDVYVALLLKWNAQIVFLSLVAYNIISLACWILRPSTSRFLAIRFGVYSGIPLAAQFLFLLTVASSGITLICSAIVGPVLALIVFLVGMNYRRRHLLGISPIWILAAIFTMIAAIALTALLLLAPIIVAIATPALNLITYIRASVMIASQHKRQFPSERMSLLFWLLAIQALAATWFAGWKIAIDVMLFEYSKLPTTPPKCYLSAAAQHRHAWLFRESAAGVSLQTKRLKFLEIALRCAAPKFHAALRQIYDHLGPPLANFCRRSRWFADLTYIALLPLEASASMLRRTIQIPRARIKRLYTND